MQKRLKKLKGEEEQAKSKGTKKERNEGVSIAYIKTCIQTLYDAKMISVDEAIVTYSRITKDSVLTKNVNDFTTDVSAFEGRSYSEIDCAGLIANALARYANKKVF